jgi:CHRD domain
MRKTLGLFVATSAVVAAGAVAVAGTDGGDIKETLNGYEENMAVSTPGVGEFRARVDSAGETIGYTLSFEGIPSDVRQAHIHFEKRTNNGPIVAWLCDSAANPSPRASTPECPAGGGTVEGVIERDDVGTGSAGQGIAAGEFEEFVQAIGAGVTYVNVHSVAFPGGEIRSQIGRHGGHQDND